MVTIQQTQEMFNLTVDEAHTFYVGNDGWLVHNEGRPSVATPAPSSGMTRVGRWMSPAEYESMVKTGRVQVPHGGGGTYVALPSDPDAFIKQAKPGSVYVEFDVPTSSLKQTKEGWGYVQNNTTMEARLAQKKGLPVPEAPSFENIGISCRKP